MAVKLNSTGGGSVTLDSPSTASNYTVTLPSAAGTLATTTGTGSVFTNPTINGFTGDTSAITIGTTQFVKDTSGNVGIGTASPGAKLEVSAGSAAFAYSSASRFIITNNNAYATNTYYGVNTLYLSNASTTAGTGSGIAFGSTGSGTGSICTIAGIATNNSGYGSALVFQTRDTSGNDAERMRLDSSGNLLVGTTSGTGYCRMNLSTDSGTNKWDVGPRLALATNFYILQNQANGVYIASGANAWTTYSDERLKTDLKPIENAAQKVSTLRAVTGRFKTDDESVSRSFLIAQDVQAVLPEAVDASDPDKLGVAYTDTIPLLVAAIKELSAQNNALEARLAQLEAK